MELCADEELVRGQLNDLHPTEHHSLGDGESFVINYCQLLINLQYPRK
jgi:hypothetical protein